MQDKQLHDFITMKANEFKIPGVAIGVFTDDKEIYECHGVTSIENPLPVDQDTLFILGSVTKTFTATTLMRLVAEGKVKLDAPVRQYVPELKLADEQSAKKIQYYIYSTIPLGWTGGSTSTPVRCGSRGRSACSPPDG